MLPMAKEPGFTSLGKKENFLGLEKEFSSYASAQIAVLPFPMNIR